MVKIAIARGNGREKNIIRVLDLLKNDIEKSIRNKKSDILFIKVNTTNINFPNACTHPSAVETVINYFSDRFETIIVGDNSFRAYKDENPYNYLKRKGVILTNLTEYPSVPIEFRYTGFIRKNKIKKSRISLLPKKAFTISLALPKTHDSVVFTGCSKNMMGCVLGPKWKVHGLPLLDRFFVNRVVESNRFHHENLRKIIEFVKPDLAILDAFYGMEGDGPIFGDMVELNMALCSENCYTPDRLMSEIVGFNEVPYLPKIKNYKIIGTKNLDGIPKFKPHYFLKYQLMKGKMNGIKLDFKFPPHFLRQIIDKL